MCLTQQTITNKIKLKMDNVNERLIFGEKGLVMYSTGESSTNEIFCVIQSMEESVISVSDVSNSDPIVDLTIPAGVSLYGILEGITVTSGKVVAYKR